MADLLECLIQIKALRDTSGRVADRARAALAAGDAARVEALAADEETVAARLRGALPGGPGLPSPGRAAASPPAVAAQPEAPTDPVGRFLAARDASLALLDRCSAADLAARVEVPGRGSTTVADLVALMLASDTTVAGELAGFAGAVHTPET